MNGQDTMCVISIRNIFNESSVVSREGSGEEIWRRHLLSAIHPCI